MSFLHYPIELRGQHFQCLLVRIRPTLITSWTTSYHSFHNVPNFILLSEIIVYSFPVTKTTSKNNLTISVSAGRFLWCGTRKRVDQRWPAVTYCPRVLPDPAAKHQGAQRLPTCPSAGFVTHAQLRHSSCCYSLSSLTHWGRDKMAAIFQTTFSNAFSWMQINEFWLRFHWSLFLRVQLTIFQYWFR